MFYLALKYVCSVGLNEGASYPSDFLIYFSAQVLSDSYRSALHIEPILSISFMRTRRPTFSFAVSVVTGSKTART